MSPAVEAFVLRWGDLGGQWGVNRSVAQIQALLFLSDRPLNAEEIAETLGLARSNVSNSLKELLTWKLIERTPVRGDRRDHFTAETDIWQMTVKIAEGRKAREIDPMVAAIDAVVETIDDDPALSPVVTKRMRDMHEFVHVMDRWYGDMLKTPPAQILSLIRLGARVTGLLRFVGRLPGAGKGKEP